MTNSENPELGIVIVKKKSKESNYSTHIVSNCREVILHQDHILVRYWGNIDSNLEGYLDIDATSGQTQKLSRNDFIEISKDCSKCKSFIPI